MHLKIKGSPVVYHFTTNQISCKCLQFPKTRPS